MSEIDYGEWFDDGKKEPDKLFAALCRTIIGQQLAGKAAEAIFKRFADFFKGDIKPKKILKYKDSDLRGLGLSWSKARSILDLAAKVEFLELEKIEMMTDGEVAAKLIQVKGIGQWTAEMFLMFNLGRENVFSMGDLGLRNGIKRYLGKTEISDRQILKLIKNWHPYKTYGAIAMWNLLDGGK